jgi:hypothetical protein
MNRAKNNKSVSDIRFGTVALERGFLTPGQLGKAVSIQMKEDLEGLSHRLIGEVLVDLGFMSIFQVNEVIETIESGYSTMVCSG